MTGNKALKTPGNVRPTFTTRACDGSNADIRGMLSTLLCQYGLVSQGKGGFYGADKSYPQVIHRRNNMDAVQQIEECKAILSAASSADSLAFFVIVGWALSVVCAYFVGRRDYR